VDCVAEASLACKLLSYLLYIGGGGSSGGGASSLDDSRKSWMGLATRKKLNPLSPLNMHMMKVINMTMELARRSATEAALEANRQIANIYIYIYIYICMTRARESKQSFLDRFVAIGGTKGRGKKEENKGICGTCYIDMLNI
jgi:hypothetical protein